MATTYSIYCDESCHLEKDRQKVMVLGAVWCPSEKVREYNVKLRDLKEKHGLSRLFESKWTKVSNGKIDYYIDLLNFFFDHDDIFFRALVIPEKDKLRHRKFSQNHNTWYYKMFFTMLKVIFSPEDEYKVFLDVKDTCSAQKVAKLHEALCNSLYDFDRKIIKCVQTIRSNEVEMLQLADLLIGIINYANRSLGQSEAKSTLVEAMKKRSGYNLVQPTLMREKKVNLFVWRSSEVVK